MEPSVPLLQTEAINRMELELGEQCRATAAPGLTVWTLLPRY